MKSWQLYFEVMREVVEDVLNTQEANIMKAAEILTNTTRNNGIIHLFGSGHSSLITEDVFWRAATLANVHAIFESAVAGINEVTKTSKIEKLGNRKSDRGVQPCGSARRNHLHFQLRQ